MIDVGTAVGYLLLDTSKWDASLKQAKSDFKTFGDQTTSASDKFAAAGKAMTSVGKSLTVGVTAPLVGMGAIAVTAAADFEEAMSQVQATMLISKDAMVEVHGETVNAMDALTEAARKAGADTKYSAVEASEALNYLALAGYSVEQSIDALPKVLNLASAGNMELARASDLVTDSMSALGLSMDELEGFTDKLAMTASKSNTSVAQLGEAMLVAGGQASLVGMSVTDLSTSLGILADNGIKGSEGGTMLRNTLKNLYTPTDQARQVMESLGVQTKNAMDGSLRPAQDVLRDLSMALSGLTEEERLQKVSEIFDTAAIAGANVLLENCADRWDQLSDSIDNSAGAAQNMAEIQEDNLDGALKKLQSGITEVQIAFGNLLLPVIKDVTEVLKDVVAWINSLDDSQKKTIITILEVLAVAGPILLLLGSVASGISSLIPLISLVTGATGAATVATTAAGVSIGGLLGPIALAIAAVGALGIAWATNFGGIRDVTKEFVEDTKEDMKKEIETIKNFMDMLNDFGKSIADFFKNIRNSINKAVRDVFNESSRMSVSPVSTSGRGGSFASGLDYVPRDMNVRVHEGESILTKNQTASFFTGEPSEKVYKFDLSIPLDGEVIAHKQYTFNEREGILRGDDLVLGGVMA